MPSLADKASSPGVAGIVRGVAAIPGRPTRPRRMTSRGFEVDQCRGRAPEPYRSAALLRRKDAIR